MSVVEPKPKQLQRTIGRKKNIQQYQPAVPEVTNQTEQLLELFSQALNFLRLKDVKIALYIIFLTVCGCFDRTHNVTCWV